MTTLVNILKNQTQSLKNQYVSLTKEWASEDFNRLRDFTARYELGSNAFASKNEYWDAQKKYYRLSKSVINNKPADYVAEVVKSAEAHYEMSIEKLAARIEKKGLNQNNLKIETAHVGVNIETTLTDGDKKVRAYTIIAEGEIQRPHYRYLIK